MKTVPRDVEPGVKRSDRTIRARALAGSDSPGSRSDKLMAVGQGQG